MQIMLQIHELHDYIIYMKYNIGVKQISYLGVLFKTQVIS